MNNHRVAMSSMVSAMVIVIMMIGTDCHYPEGCMIRGIKSIIIWRNVRHINRRIDILNHRRRFYDHDSRCCCSSSRSGSRNRIGSCICGIRRNRWGSRFRFNHIVLPIQIFISNNLKCDLPVFILR